MMSRMNHNKIIEPIGFVVAFLSLVLSFFLFSSDTAQPMGSLAAALMTAGLVWITYIILRWVLLAMR